MRIRIRIGIGALLVFVPLVTGLSPLAADEPPQSADTASKTLRFYGYGHDLKTGAYLYTEVQNLVVKGSRLIRGTTKFYADDGHLLGRRTLDFTENEQVPVYQLELFKPPYREGITAVDAHALTMSRTEHGTTTTATLPLQSDMAADAGFDRLIVHHFSELQAGKTVDFILVVPGRLTDFKFRAHKSADTQFEGHPAIALTIELDSLIRLVTPALKLIYRVEDQRLVEFAGLSNIRDPVTGDNYTVRIDYNSVPPADAPKVLPPLEN